MLVILVNGCAHVSRFTVDTVTICGAGSTISKKLDDPMLGARFGFGSFVGLTEDEQEAQFQKMTQTDDVNFDVLDFI